MAEEYQKAMRINNQSWSEKRKRWNLMSTEKARSRSLGIKYMASLSAGVLQISLPYKKFN